MYHRILPKKGSFLNLQAGMYVEPETFEMHIRYLKQHFDVLSLSEIFSSIQNMERSRSNRPLCVLTFDDGWLDFFKFAYPALKQNQVPATVFLPTGYIGTNDWFWTDRLARILGTDLSEIKPEKSGSKLNDPLLKRIAGLKGGYEKRLETAIEILKNRNHSEVEEVIAALTDIVDVGDAPFERVFLSWGEVREMVKSGLVFFGSHTHNHRILVHLEEEEIREELVLSKETLLREGAVDPSFIPFCYPNGNWNDRIARIVRETGYHAAVSTGNGWNPKGATPFDLKRVAIHQDMTASREMFGCRIAEIL